MLKFPTQDAKQINQDPRRLLLVAQSKVGKTSLIQTLPSCLNIDLNDSADTNDAIFHVDIFKTHSFTSGRT